MALPKKPTRKTRKDADEFIRNAAATKADQGVRTRKTGRPPGPPKKRVIISFTLPILATIESHKQNDRSYFVDQAMRDYFKDRGITIEGEEE